MKPLNRTDRLNIQRSLATEFKEFVPLAWPILDPGQPFVPGWHIDAIADHLEAVARGDIRRLVINVPPGFSKSSLTGIYFPAWLWGPFGKTSSRFIGASHEQGLATRDNRRTRLLIESDWYQELWPNQITSDQNEKTYFENEQRGFRQSCAVKSMTGRRGDVVLWDDPQNPEQANSEVERETATRVFSETLPSRLVDPRRSAIIVIMQRLHEEDVTGYILKKELDYEHLMLPMEYEKDRACKTSIGFKDPRTKEGELLDPERFPAEVVEQAKKEMGSYATAGQYQQRPVPRGGGLFKKSDFKMLPASPAGCQWVRGWDIAASDEAESAFTVGVKMGLAPDGRIIVGDVDRFQGSPFKVETRMRNVAGQDGRVVRGSIPQDPGAGGKFQAQYLIKALAGFRYFASPESGDKITRAEPFAAQVEAGNVYLVEGSWTDEYLNELGSFPRGSRSDQVDASSRAFLELMTRRQVKLRGKQG